MTELNDDDVLSLASQVPFFLEATTFKVSQMKRLFKRQFVDLTKAAHAGQWLEQGFDGEVLRASNGQGWKKGKIRLRLEIVLDEPEPPVGSALQTPEPSDAVLSPNSQQ
jgi:hypothetical protein